MTIKVDLSSERMLGNQERAANRGFLSPLERDASKSSVSIRCKKIFFDSFMKSSAVGISSLGIYLLLFPVAGAEDERDLSAASHSSLFISKNLAFTSSVEERATSSIERIGQPT
jgi:hypothetical protein